MKYFNKSALAKAGGIPNIEEHPSVWIEHAWVEDYNETDRRVCQVLDNDSEEVIISWYTDHADNPSRYHFRIKTCNVDLAHEMGLLLNPRSWRDKSDAILDTLYYDVNPSSSYHNNGLLKRGVWNHLKKRLKSPTMFNSQFTHRLLNELWNHWFLLIFPGNLRMDLCSRLDIDDISDEWNYVDQDIQKEIRKLFKTDLERTYDISRFTLKWCPFAEQWYPMDATNRLNLSGINTYISVGQDPRDHGYEQAEGYSSIWIREDEVCIDGEVIKGDASNFARCRNCDKRRPVDCMDGDRCVDCLGSSYRIHNYSTKVDRELGFKKGLHIYKELSLNDKELFLGCELEYVSKNQRASRLQVGKLLMGHALMKSDASISKGFEITTCPATIDIHKVIFKTFFDKLPKGLDIDKTSGMHVHLSKKYLSRMTLGKMTEFLNKESNSVFIDYIAGRKENNYCTRDKGRKLTYLTHEKHRGERQNICNTSNSTTLEIRMFSTPKTFNDFSHKMEFCKALAQYCSPCSTDIPLKELTNWQSFGVWLGNYAKEYPTINKVVDSFCKQQVGESACA